MIGVCWGISISTFCFWLSAERAYQKNILSRLMEAGAFQLLKH